MGSAQAQGPVWGVQARNWADLMEKMALPIYHVVLDKTNVSRGTRLLDIGCGTGMAAQLAAMLGAEVTGLDASEAQLDIARERIPNGDFRCGEMEELPYAAGESHPLRDRHGLMEVHMYRWSPLGQQYAR